MLTFVLGGVIIVLTWSVLLGSQGIGHVWRLRSERQRLGEAAAHILAANAQRRDETRRLRHDDAYLEALVRREFRLVRPNEVVYRFKPGAPPRTAR